MSWLFHSLVRFSQVPRKSVQAESLRPSMRSLRHRMSTRPYGKDLCDKRFRTLSSLEDTYFSQRHPRMMFPTTWLVELTSAD